MRVEVSSGLKSEGQGIGIQSEIAQDGSASPLHDQIVRHMADDGAPLRLVRNDTEIVS